MKMITWVDNDGTMEEYRVEFCAPSDSIESVVEEDMMVSSGGTSTEEESVLSCATEETTERFYQFSVLAISSANKLASLEEAVDQLSEFTEKNTDELLGSSLRLSQVEATANVSAYDLSVEQKRGDKLSCKLESLEEKLGILSNSFWESRSDLDIARLKLGKVETKASLNAAEISMEQPRVEKLTRNVEFLEKGHSVTDGRMDQMEADMGILMANQKTLQKRTKKLKGRVETSKEYQTYVRKSYDGVKEEYESLKLRMKDIGGGFVGLLDPLHGALEDLWNCMEGSKEANEKKRKRVDP
jgi:hypothetical protein